jgi:hypothetical protein
MRYGRFGTIVLLTTVVGCGLDDVDSAEIEPLEGALGADFTTFSLPGDPNVEFQQFAYGPDKNDYACFLGAISGPRNGTFSWGNLIRDPTGTRWYLRSAGENPVSANCVRVSWFQTVGTARLQRTTGEGSLDHTDGSAWAEGSAANIETDEVELWPARAASHVTGVYGYLRNRNSHIRIEKGALGTTPARVKVTSASGYLQAYSGSFFAGTPGTTMRAAYVGPTYGFAHSGGKLWRTEVMARTSEAICFFTQIGGDLTGPTDTMTIRPRVVDGVERWVLEARALGIVVVEASCMARIQPS